MLLSVRGPRGNQRGPQHAQQAIVALSRAVQRRSTFSLLIRSTGPAATLALDVPGSLARGAGDLLRAQYPDATVAKMAAETVPTDHVAVRHYLRLVPDIRGLILSKDYEDGLTRSVIDPITALLESLAPQNSSQQCELRFEIETAPNRWRRRARRIGEQHSHAWLARWPSLADRYAKWAMGTPLERTAILPCRWVLPRNRTDVPPGIELKLNDYLYRVRISVSVTAPAAQRAMSEKRLRQIVAALSPLTHPGQAEFQCCARPIPSLLCAAELATLWHLPTELVETPQAAETSYRQLPAPVNLPEEKDNTSKEGMVLGRVAYANDRRLCCVPVGDRLHTLLVGKSGVGKSTLLHNMVAADAVQQGMAVVDPHGDLIDDVVTTIPRSRTNDVVILDPACPQPVTYNPLACDDPQCRPLVAEGLLAALQKVFGFDESTAPRLINTLRYTVLALLESGDATLLSIRPMLTDKRYRQQVVNRVQDSEVRDFWLQEVANWTDRYEKEATPAILNKLGQFTANPLLRRVLDAPRGSLDLRHVMDSQQILLASLSQGKIGEDASRLLGSLLMAGIQQAAMSRADLSRDRRSPFYVYADEYATYVNESFADTLAQARKYGLYLTAAQQIIGQVDESIMSAMFGNCATLVCFQVARDDAERLAEQLTGKVTPEDLQRLPRYTAMVKMAIEGVPTRPFTIATLPPPQPRRTHAQPQQLTKVSRRRYGRAT